MEYGFIYDKAIAPSSKSIPNTSNPVYTLLFDNYDATLAVDKQSAVFVALELVNNCQDFYGNKNLIKKGGSFYLIGKLDPQKTGLTKPTWPTYHKLPPYATDGTSIEGWITAIFDSGIPWRIRTPRMNCDSTMKRSQARISRQSAANAPKLLRMVFSGEGRRSIAQHPQTNSQ